MRGHSDLLGRRGVRRGFTILELALALALISLVAVLAIPAFYSRPEVTLDRAAQLLARDLRLAQHEAIRLNRDVIFEFHLDGRGYAPRFEDGTPLPNPVGRGSFERRYSRDAVFEGVHIGRLQLAGEPRSIRFDPLGHALGGGSIELTFGAEVCMVHVAESNGMVSLHELHGPTE